MHKKEKTKPLLLQVTKLLASAELQIFFIRLAKPIRKHCSRLRRQSTETHFTKRKITKCAPMFLEF